MSSFNGKIVTRIFFDFDFGFKCRRIFVLIFNLFGNFQQILLRYSRTKLDALTVIMVCHTANLRRISPDERNREALLREQF